jgi:hypothetical protein
MIIMNKFKKRLTKLNVPLKNAIVLGQGAGIILDIVNIFQTVFVFSETPQFVKARNIVYRTDLTNLHLLIDISVIFVDREYIGNLENFYTMCRSNKTTIFIEGTEPVGGGIADSLTSARYQVTHQLGSFHVWKRS